MLNVEYLVKNTLAATLDFSDVASIHSNHHLKKDLKLDSMGSLMLLIKLEENIEGFYVDPETFQLRDLETVSSLVRYVNMQILNNNTVH